MDKSKTSKKINTLSIAKDETKTKERQFAEVVLTSSNINTVTATRYVTNSISGDVNLKDAIAVMKEKIADVNGNNLQALEGTLTAQIVSLDTIFNSLALKSLNSDRMNQMEGYLRLALKSQSQCTRTIEVLANLKNPPIVYAKQANIANGNQQVNNGTMATTSHAEKKANQPNELLEAYNGRTTMDTSTAKTTRRKDKAMAALEK
jgi:hypothetical protein